MVSLVLRKNIFPSTQLGPVFRISVKYEPRDYTTLALDMSYSYLHEFRRLIKRYLLILSGSMRLHCSCFVTHRIRL